MRKLLLPFLFLAAACFGQHSVTLTWVDVINPTGTMYNVYRLSGPCPGLHPPLSDFVKLTASPLSVLTFQDLAVVAAQTYCYVATAIFGGTESSPSNDAGATIPVSPPNLGKPAIAESATTPGTEAKIPDDPQP